MFMYVFGFFSQCGQLCLCVGGKSDEEIVSREGGQESRVGFGQS